MAKIATAEWFKVLGEKLNSSEKFAKNAKGFTVDILFVADEERKTVFTINDGVVTDVHAGEPGDEEKREFVIQATPQIWANLQNGTQPARLGLMMGRIKLVKGDMAKMLKYLGAAGLIFDVMKQIPTEG